MVHPESRLTENAKTRKTNDVLDEMTRQARLGAEKMPKRKSVISRFP